MRALTHRLEAVEKRLGAVDEDQLWSLRRQHYTEFRPVFFAAIDGEITWDSLHEWCEKNPGPDHGRKRSPWEVERAHLLRQELEAKLKETRERIAIWAPELLEGVC
jgi:hypothetical protein